MLQVPCKLIGLVCAAAVTLAGLPIQAAAQSAASYPNKPVRIVLPFPPGGSTSTVGTIYSKKMNEDWKQSVLLDNRGGGNTIIGSEIVAKAAADGYTLLGTTSTHIINPWLQPKLPYDTFKDFVGVSTLTRADFMMAASPAFAPNTLKEFIAYVKANPGKVNSATVGLGTIQHLVIELFMDASGTQFTIVPYKGGGQVNPDLMAGRLQIAFNNPASFAELIKSGKLKGIAISGDKRKAALPNIPTFAESGLNYSGANWMALIAPAATPKDIVQKINAEIAKLQAMPEVIQQINNQAIDPFPNSVASTEALFRNDYERYGRIIKEKNIKADPED